MITITIFEDCLFLNIEGQEFRYNNFILLFGTYNTERNTAYRELTVALGCVGNIPFLNEFFY